MKNRAAAIIPHDNGIIFIKRIKGYGENKDEYYTIPGGGIESWETVEEAVMREVKEEIGIDIFFTGKKYELEDDMGKQYYFVAKYKSGEIGTGQGEEMVSSDYDKHGVYIPEIISKHEIKNIRLLPERMKNIILEDIDSIFD